MKEKCKKCKVLERKLLQLADKYEKLVMLGMRGKTMDDIDRNLAERKLLDILRDNGVFEPQVSTMQSNNIYMSSVSQTFNWGKAKEVINDLHKFL